MPSDAAPSMILAAARIRRDRRRQDKIDLALATANLILAGFSTKPHDTLDAVAHMFTEDELKTIRQEQEERRELANQQAQLMKLRLRYNGRRNNNQNPR